MDAINIDDLRNEARRFLPKIVWDYLDGGSEDEITLAENRKAFSRYVFRPRVLTGKTPHDLSVELFGQKLAAPFLVGPTGLNGIFRSCGDKKLARAAAKQGVGFVLSTASNTSIEEIARIHCGPVFFQLYPWGERSISARLMARASDAGFKAIILTIDSLIPGNRERDRRNGFDHAVHISPRIFWDGVTHPRWLTSTWLPSGMPRIENVAEHLPPGANAFALANFTRAQRNPLFCWDEVEWVRDKWKLPLALKGILTAEDARIAVSIGVDHIVVSNHGGRALDGAPASLDAMMEVSKAVGANARILVDGGFRRGADVVKALALGANAVLLGRVPLYGLAANGELGVAQSLQIMREEIERVMALIGCSTIPEISLQHVQEASPGKCSGACGFSRSVVGKDDAKDTFVAGGEVIAEVPGTER